MSNAKTIEIDAESAAYIAAVSDAGKAFGRAIDKGILQDDDESAPDYAGNWMFMGIHSQTGYLQFKNIITRQYINCSAHDYQDKL